METVLFILAVLVSFLLLPILAFLVVKFGAAGYFTEKNKQNQNKKHEIEK